MAFEEAELDSARKRTCQGSGEDIGGAAEDAEENVREQEVLRTVETLVKPSARKRHVTEERIKQHWVRGNL